MGDLGNNGDVDDLRRVFLRYGAVQDVWVAHKPPGFAFVFYKTVREAQEAVRGANGRNICGVRVRVRMGSEMNHSEGTQFHRSYERDYEPPQRERNSYSRGGTSYSRGGNSSYSSRGPSSRVHRSDSFKGGGGRDYDEFSPPPPRGGFGRGGEHRSSHHSSVGRGGYSKPDVFYSSPSHSSRYGGHKRSSHPYSHGDDKYGGRGGGRMSSRRDHHASPEHFSRFSPPVEPEYRGGSGKRGDRYHDPPPPPQYMYKERSSNRQQGSGYREHHHESYPAKSHHRSRSPHSFTPPPPPPPMRSHDHHRKHKGGWGRGEYGPPTRRPRDDDDHFHRGFKDREPHEEQFEPRSYGNSSGRRSSRRHEFEDSGNNRFSRNNDQSYRPPPPAADREVKYRGHHHFSSSDHFSGGEDYHKEPPFLRQEYVEHDRSDRGSSLEGISREDEGDKFSDIVEREPNDLRRKLLSEGDSSERGATSPTERG